MYSGKNFWEQADLTITLIVIIGLGAYYWGIAFNALIVTLNDGTMPVISERPGIIVNDSGVLRQFADNDSKLLFLADRFRIDFPAIETRIPKGVAGDAFRFWATYTDYPVEGGVNIVSIGDMLHWGGSALFLFGLPLLFCRIPFHARKRITKRHIP